MFKLDIETDNAAFTGDWQIEVARILREAALQIERGSGNLALRDINGNKVGRTEYTAA